MNTMAKRFIFVFSAFLLHGCVNIPERNAADLLVGVWIINHDPNGIDYSIIEYLPTGDKCEISFKWTDSGTTRTIMYWNKWHFENGVIFTTMHATDGGLEIGLPINDRILSIQKNSFEAIIVNYPGHWDVEFHQRVKRAKTGQVCGPVKKALKADNESSHDASNETRTQEKKRPAKMGKS